MDNLDMVVPFDRVEVGKQLRKQVRELDGQCLFHRSAVESLVVQNINDVIQKNTA
jgi:hypothetical protein